MAIIEMKFTFRRGNELRADVNDFDVNSSLMFDCETYAEEWIDEKNEEICEAMDCNVLPIGVDTWELDEFDVESFDDEFANPANFSDLDEYGGYVEKCEEHGEGYCLRYDDVGEFDFDEQYNGYWNSTEEFAENLYRDVYEIPDHLSNYIDWESVARDVMMDYSVYNGKKGYHIFRD